MVGTLERSGIGNLSAEWWLDACVEAILEIQSIVQIVLFWFVKP